MVNFKQHFNGSFLALFLMSVVNLLFLHYSFHSTIGLEIPLFTTSLIDNFAATLIDITVIVGILWLITLNRLKLSLVLTFIITLIWSFCNVFYSRFFLQYLSWSSIEQADNLTDSIVIDSMMAGFKWSDLYYPLICVIFFWFFIRNRKHDFKTKSLRTIACLWTCTFCLALVSHSLYFFHPTKGFLQELSHTAFTPKKFDSMWPNWTVFHKGFIRKMFIEHHFGNNNLNLTPEQEAEIKETYSDHRLRVTKRTAPEQVKNIIFILVESYLSATSDLFVDGKEITPNLNRLRHDSTVYFNPHMQPNVAIGESSDGQFIYMAGLLPLHSEITVGRAKKNEIIGLPELLKKKYPEANSMTILPTSPTIWDQLAMTEAYGFDYLYSVIEYPKEFSDLGEEDCLNDEQVLKYAARKDKTIRKPFCSLVLTMSMHRPFVRFVEHGFTVTDKDLPQEYKNYLINCHYTDIQIGKYLDSLKENGLYDNSLIVIVADHDAHPEEMKMSGKISREIPIYIINGGFNPSTAWDGACNQLDVFTTLVDIMGIDSEWRGLGHTLLNKNYQNSVTEKIQEISDWIILGDYFKSKDIQ